MSRTDEIVGSAATSQAVLQIRMFYNVQYSDPILGIFVQYHLQELPTASAYIARILDATSYLS